MKLVFTGILYLFLLILDCPFFNDGHYQSDFFAILRLSFSLSTNKYFHYISFKEITVTFNYYTNILVLSQSWFVVWNNPISSHQWMKYHTTLNSTVFLYWELTTCRNSSILQAWQTWTHEWKPMIVNLGHSSRKWVISCQKWTCAIHIF